MTSRTDLPVDAARAANGMSPTQTIEHLLRPDLVGRSAYGAPQLEVPVALNTNENSYPVPQIVADAMVAALAKNAAELNRYPDREFTALREALASYLTRTTGVAIDPTQMWAGNGSNEVLLHVVQAFAGPGRSILAFTPSYSMYPNYALTTGSAWQQGERGPDFEVTAADAAAQVRRLDPDVILLASPNNPSGTALGLDVIEAVHEAARGIVVVDEAYAEFAREGTVSAISLLAGRPRLVVSRTMSKAFALAGGRLGYLAADPALIDALRLVRMPYHLSTQSQVVACAALEHADILQREVQVLREQRDRIVAELTDMGLRPVPSDANFVLFGGLDDEAATWQALLERGVLIRDVGLAHHLRVTAGTPEETTAFLDAMREITGTNAGQDTGQETSRIPGQDTSRIAGRNISPVENGSSHE